MGPKAIALPELAAGGALLLLTFVGASQLLSLGLERAVCVAAVRATLQLSALGYILVPVFRLNNPWIVLLYITFMATVAALEAVGRPPYRYAGMLRHVLLVVTCVAFFVAAFALFVVVRVGLDAHYAIPVVGMLLGNTSSSVAVTLGAITGAIKDSREAIEVRLAMGATRWEALKATVQNALVLGLTPTLNQMRIMGLVSIPGMMTGQILGGTQPATAARYQLVILFMIATSAVMSSTGVAALVLSACTDAEHRLHAQRLVKVQKRKESDLLLNLVQAVYAGAKGAAAGAKRWWHRMTAASSPAGAALLDQGVNPEDEEESLSDVEDVEHVEWGSRER